MVSIKWLQTWERIMLFKLSQIMVLSTRKLVVTSQMSIYTLHGALNPCGHYVSGISPGQLNALRFAFERMTDLDIAAVVLLDAQTFCAKVGSFSSPLHPENGGSW
jgi:hypothetical protein